MTTFRHVDRDGERVVARREVVEGTVVYFPLAEAINFSERLHPRGRAGRWVDKLGDFMHGKGTVVGTTPYLQRRDPGTAPRMTFASAAALHKDSRLSGLFGAFEKDAEDLASKHNVKLVRGERNVGVFEGVFEPSYALKVRGDKADIDAFNKDLGAKYDQKAVVGFTPDPQGSDAEISFTGGKDPDAFFKALVDIMGEDAGASYDDGVWRVFVYGGDVEVMRKLDDLGKRMGMSAKAAAGSGDYFQLREGDG